MYRNKQGKSVFTGFIQKGKTGTIVWIGENEKAKRRVINTNNSADADFFMSRMRQYD